MDPKELAELFNGRTYLREMTRMEEQLAKDFGLVVVFGQSDDSIEFRGSINDEAGCRKGGEISLTPDGLEWKTNKDGIGYWAGDNKIKIIWKKGETKEGKHVAWSYETEIPHEEFVIYEDDKPYCIGIVFKKEDLR